MAANSAHATAQTVTSASLAPQQDGNAMDKDRAEEIIASVDEAHDRDPYASSYKACQDAGVAFSDYKEARKIVYWPQSVRARTAK